MLLAYDVHGFKNNSPPRNIYGASVGRSKAVRAKIKLNTIQKHQTPTRRGDGWGFQCIRSKKCIVRTGRDRSVEGILKSLGGMAPRTLQSSGVEAKAADICQRHLCQSIKTVHNHHGTFIVHSQQVDNMPPKWASIHMRSRLRTCFTIAV